MGWRDSPVLQSVRAFANALEDRGAAPTLVALARKLLEKIDKVALFGSPKSTMVLLPSPSRINLAPRGVAVALTMLESERYRRIIPSDCVDWLKYKSPNALSSFLKEHDKISSWINKSVLRPDRLSDRTERMKYFLCVAEECRKLGNLSSTCAVFNGLSPLPKNIRWRTSGLRTAASVKAIANAADFVSQEHEYQGYYNVLRASQKTCVPWLRAHLHGIRSMHDSRSTFKSQDGLKDVVDFKLYREIQEEVHHMLSYQETQMDHVKDDLDIRTFVESELDSPVVDRSELDSPVGDQPEFDSLVVDHSFYNRPENRTLGPARRKPIAIRSLFALQKMKTFMLMPNKTPRRKPTLATVSEPSISIQSIDTTTSVQDDISERCLDGQVNIRHGLPIAGGYYADVWEGMLGARKIAVKTLRPNSTGTAIITEIQRECLAWTSFNHPNILECLGFSTCVSMNTDLPALISPWMQNGTVLSYLEARPEADRYEHLLGIAQGLSYLHTKQITHGNLRASNVLVSDHGVPLLAGFGGARVIQNSGATAVSRQYLSMRWKSPELFDMNSIPRPSSDVWSYGMTVLVSDDTWLYDSTKAYMKEIASGYAPFQELGNSPALYHLIPSGTKPLRPDNARAPVLTDELWALCEDCWSTLPGARPSMGEVISRLDMIRPRHLEP
ncbi:kinase-like protein [Ramaria rubella]|nr:kinase-like protein [Ramaria rubella]